MFFGGKNFFIVNLSQYFLIFCFKETDKGLSTKPETTVITGNKPHILVVDDNSDMREYIFKLLKDQYEVQLACDGLHALELISKNVPDLILSDIMMPRMDGYVLMNLLY